MIVYSPATVFSKMAANQANKMQKAMAEALGLREQEHKRLPGTGRQGTGIQNNNEPLGIFELN